MYGFPLRSKQDCYSAAANFHDATRERRPSTIRACSSDHFSPLHRSDDFWDAPFCAASPFEREPFRGDADPLYPSRPTTYGSSLPRGRYESHGVTSERAIAGLYAALEHADQDLQAVNKAFNMQMAPLAHWLPTQYIDSLWAIYTDWDGQVVGGEAFSKTPKLGGTSSMTTTTTFNQVDDRIAKATDALRHPTSHLPEDGISYRGPLSSSGRVKVMQYDSWDEVETTVRKLQISLDVIEEKISIVRRQRHRMDSLLREIVAAKQLLEGIGGFWDVSRRQGEDRKGRREGGGQEAFFSPGTESSPLGERMMGPRVDI